MQNPLKALIALLVFAVALEVSPACAQLAKPPPPAKLEERARPLGDNADTMQAPAGTLIARPSLTGEPTTVGVGIYVLDVDAIDSANQNFSAGIFFAATWRDPKLAHQGPGSLVMPLSSVWTPRLGFVNQQQAWTALPHFVEVFPSGDVVYRQKIWGWFSQPLDLREFPLDRQVLTLHMVASGLLENEVRLVGLTAEHGRQSGIAQSFSLPDFSVSGWTAEPRSFYPVKGEIGTAGFALDIIVDRIPNYYIWKLIVPLCLIVAMSWVPRWIEPNEIGTSIGIAATSFLTLVAYLFATAVLLPRVAYFTRVDLFILLSTVLVFLSLVQTAFNSYMSRHDRFSDIEWMHRWSRTAYPVMLAIVLAISFLG